MPPKKAKDENNPQSNKISNTSSFAPETKTPDVQVQNTKYEGIVLRSAVAQQLDKDIDCAINDNISSSNKKVHGSINHLRMRELMEPDMDANEQEENIVSKLKASILVDVKGIREEIITSFNGAAYDILQDVLGQHLPKVLHENEILKNLISDLTKEVSALKI